MAALKNPHNLIDILAVLPLIVRLEYGLRLPTLETSAVRHYILVRRPSES